MPYIIPEKRHALDQHIDSLLNAIRELECDEDVDNTGGNLNYIITRLLVRVYGNGGYADRAEAISVLECAKLEFYRKHLAAYEDQKEFENGSVE
jgi:hypothetical protein